MTNGDKIRAMTDDEELLSAIGTGCDRCAYRNGECDSGYGEGCIAGNLKWLKQEIDANALAESDSFEGWFTGGTISKERFAEIGGDDNG